MAYIAVNFNKEVGKIKPLNGVNAGPKTTVFTYDATELFQEANIPCSRLHDVEYPYGSGEFVDVHCVFPNFEADVNDPSSYNFGLTDLYIKAVIESGAKVIYRLGESIEHAPVKRHIYPPKDFKKWAQICEHIILHYNEGWADGHHWDIEYWEIWNEPDGSTDKLPEENHATWVGDRKLFFDFYEVTAKYLKEQFPHLKIGGPSLESKVDWADDFVAELAKRNVPLDFFSWHTYHWRIDKFLWRSNELHQILMKNGYVDTELVLDEWNYMESWNHQPRSFRKLVGATGAAFCGAVMVAMQSTPNTIGAYFEADVIKEWCGLFQVKDMAIGPRKENKDRCILEPRKPFYAFKAFGKLLSLGTEVECFCEENGVYVCAAKNEEEQAVMLVSYRSNIVNSVTEVRLNGIPKGGCQINVYLTDEGSDEKLEKTICCQEETFVLPLNLIDEQVRLIKIQRNRRVGGNDNEI